MKNTKHTPGPWRYTPSPKGGYNIRYGNNIALARIPNIWHPLENAQLISAAPDMLAALEAQEAASAELSMVIHFQGSEEKAKTYDQKKTAHDNYLDAATKADTLQDMATAMRRAAIRRAIGEDK